MRHRLLFVTLLVLLALPALAQVADLQPLTLGNVAPAQVASLPAAPETVALPALQDAAPADDDGLVWRWSVIKTADTLTSIGIGASLRLFEISDTAGLWIDGAPCYDDVSSRVAGFIGLSTEAEGLPLVRNLAKVFNKALGAGCSNVGFGLMVYDDQGELEARGVAYATWQF